MSVVNLFDLSKNFQRGGTQEVLMQQFLRQQQQDTTRPASSATMGGRSPLTATTPGYGSNFRDGYGPLPTRESTMGMTTGPSARTQREAVLD